MGFKPITRNMPKEEPPNILSEDDAAIYRGILGQDGVLNIGSKLKSTVLSNNKVRVGDGVINVDGHIGRNAYADYEDLTIENGAAGQKRNDLIIASFSTTGSGGLDTYVLKVKKGVAGSTGTDPEVTKQDIYAGGKLREYPLYRVKLDGLSIVGVEQLFKVIPTVPELETKYNELNSAMSGKAEQSALNNTKKKIENLGRIFQSAKATDVSVPNVTDKSIVSLTFEPGTYIITAGAEFPVNNNGHRRMHLTQTEDSAATGYGVSVTAMATPYLKTTLSLTRIIKFSEKGTEYLTVSQSSGGSLKVSGMIEAVRIL